MDLDRVGREAPVADQDPVGRDVDLADLVAPEVPGPDREARLIVPTANPSACNASC